MSTLSETISSALAAAGSAAESRLHDIIAELDGLNLSDDDRLTALASAVAAAAVIYHSGHKAVFLDAVKSWSLEISVGRAGTARRPSGASAKGSSAEGAEILVSGLDALLETLHHVGVRVQDRLVTELALFARLFGCYDAKTIHLALMAAGTALSEASYRPGQMVEVPLEAVALPLGRDACLATVAPRGLA
ncbi:MAG TPA: hypothetical protein VN832_01125 [Stellaceae bacterium]|nr:hypothetical protein [Stellaceae bacterium]